MTSFQLIVDHIHAQMRLDKVLTQQHDEYSRSQIQTWIQDGLVKVNQKLVKANYKCQIGDVIEWTIPDEPTIELIPEAIPLDIVYEDNDLMVINKPKGMVVYPTDDHQTGTLVNALLHYTDELSNVNGEERPGIVHRLDKDTSGLLLVAKNNETHHALHEQMLNRKIIRKYEAIVHGQLQTALGTIKAPIGRDPKNRLRMTVIEDGKYAVTHFKVLQTFTDFTYVECQLETGRMHQIRVHMQYIHHPIVGDLKYGGKKIHGSQGQALYAKELEFFHPRTNEALRITIHPPEEFKILLKKIAMMS